MAEISKQEYEKLSYGELVKLRIELQEEIHEYEIYKSQGSHLWPEFIEIPDTPQGYRQNLKRLAELNEYMSEVYEPDTPVVDESDEMSMLQFAEGVFWGDETAEPDKLNAVVALAYLMRLSDRGNADAMNMIGAMYYEGRYMEQDYKIAAKWYIKAAENGSSQAMSNTGYCFYYGNGVEVDYEKAYLYFSKAAMLGEWDAINKMGDMYRDGRYVREDKKTAFEIYTRGSKKIPKEVLVDAYPANLLRLGECRMYGWGCKVNLSAAEEMLKDAVEVFRLQVGYGRCYAKPGLARAKKLLGLLKSKKEEE